jgi:uncharacterized MAPEG superfamily protein
MLLSLAILTAGALVFLAAAVQHLNTVTANGIAFAFTDRSTPLSREGFAGRAARTVQNNLESAAMFTPPAILLLVTGAETPLTAAAAGTYIAARIAFTLAYWSARNRLRSASWGLSIAAIAVTTASAGHGLLG